MRKSEVSGCRKALCRYSKRFRAGGAEKRGKEPAVIVSCFKYSALQRNAQPSPQVAIFGVWGDITNKHSRGFSGDGKSSGIGIFT